MVIGVIAGFKVVAFVVFVYFVEVVCFVALTVLRFCMLAWFLGGSVREEVLTILTLYGHVVDSKAVRKSVHRFA